MPDDRLYTFFDDLHMSLQLRPPLVLAETAQVRALMTRGQYYTCLNDRNCLGTLPNGPSIIEQAGHGSVLLPMT